MDRPLHILHLEDDPTDSTLARETLEAGGFRCEMTRVDTQPAFCAGLERGGFDLILADNTLPSFDGLSALQVAMERRPEVPFIFVSGTLDEEVAIESLKVGATDYIFKTKISRIVPSVRRALREAEDRARRAEAELALGRSESYLIEAQRLSHTGSFGWNPANDTITWSEETYRIFGVEPGTRPTLDLVVQRTHPDDRAPVQATIECAQRDGKDFEHQYRLLLPDGAVKRLHVVARALTDDAGRLEFVGAVMDVTDRERAEDERRGHLWFLEGMDRVHRAIQGASDLERMTADVLDAVMEIFACDFVCLRYPSDPEAASYPVRLERTRAEGQGASALEGGLSAEEEAEAANLVRLAAAAAGAVLMGPDHQHPLPPKLAERYGVQSAMVMLLEPQGDRPYLFGVHQCAGPRRWTPQEQRLFEEIGHRVAGALTGLLMLRGLRDSERRLDQSQRMAHIGHWERDFAAGLVTLSDESCRIFGLPPEQLVVVLEQWHDRWLSLIHPEDRRLAVAALEAALDGAAPYDVEYRVVRPSGAVRLIRSRCEVVRDETGRPRRMMGMMQDITDLRQAEHGLRESEARFRTFVDHATDAFFLHDDDLRVIDVNRQACASLGYSRDELIGLHPRDFDIGLDEATLGRLTARVGAGETVTFESLHRRKDGAVFPVEIRSGQFQQGDRRFRLSLARDITERKRAEAELLEMRERFRILAESSLTGIYLTEGTRFAYVNPAMAKMFGYTVQELVGGGLGSLDLTCPEDRHLVGENMRRRLDGEVDEVRYEFRGLRKDGSVFPVEVHGRRIELGQKLGVLGTLIDNTERERARRLELEQQSAIAAERTRLAGEIHDTLAQGLAMIVMQLADAEAKLGPAWARAEKPLGVVRELAVESLAYARRSVTMLQPSAPAAGLARTIRDLADSVRRHFGAPLSFTVTGTAVLLPESVESALAGIAREALTNAARHSGAARVEVELAFRDGGVVRLAVVDDGVGFDLAQVRPDAYGLTSMQHRAARAGVALTFVTEPGAGTEVVASWSP